jgi:CubicO group peptidase (beta-lactamase class C family)
MKLADEGRLDLLDPLSKWFPEFRGTGKDDLLVIHLLTHTSGLADFGLPAGRPMQGGVEGVALRDLKHRPGSSFKYADINFILLGELVRRASGEEISSFASTRFYTPLRMVDTGFNPGDEMRWRCAATLNGSGCSQYGRVQDPNARLLGGVAGHAGLFSTAADLSRFCRMLLRGGELEGNRVLTETAVRQMVSPFPFQGGAIVRGIGWDMVSPYSSPKGNGFSGSSFGHTGYSGCSVWIDPELDLYVILLTSRRDYHRVRDFNRLRGSISTLAAELFRADKNRPQCRENAGKQGRQKT